MGRKGDVSTGQEKKKEGIQKGRGRESKAQGGTKRNQKGNKEALGCHEHKGTRRKGRGKKKEAKTPVREKEKAEGRKEQEGRKENDRTWQWAKGKQEVKFAAEEF